MSVEPTVRPNAGRGSPEGDRDDPLPIDLTSATLGGLAWVAGGRVVQHVAVIAATAVLARLLTPTDFGLVAMTTVFTGFAAVFVDLGLTAALVQRSRLSEAHLSAALSVNIGTSLILAAVLAALSPLIAALYGEAIVMPMMLVLVIAFPLSALAAVQVGLAERAMDFRRLTRIETGATVVSFGVAVVAAASGLGVWSLVLQPVVQAGARSAALWWSSDWRPARRLDRAAARELLDYGGHLAGANATNYWIRSVDQLAVGAFAGAGQLGLYSRAAQLVLLPLTQITWVSGRVMFPALSRLNTATLRARAAYLRAVGLIAFVAFPLMVILFVAAVPLIAVLLGGQWAGSVPIFRILCVVGLVQSVTATAGWLYQSHGRTRWMFRWGLVNVAVTCVAVAIGVHWGAIGVASAYAIRTVLLAGPALAISGSLVGLRLRDHLRALGGIAGASLVVAAATVVTDRALADVVPIVRLAADLSVGACVYMAVVTAARLDAWAEARAVVRQLVRRRMAETAA